MKPNTQSFYEVAVQQTIEAVAAALDRALDLRVLARAAALSPFHFHRIFRGMLGETPLELHRRLRLERAAWCLLNEETPITSLAFDAGYETHESFTRAFRARYDCAPSDFRQRGRGGKGRRPFPIELAAQSGIHFRAGSVDLSEIHFIHGEIRMNTVLKDMPPLRVVAVRHTGPYHRIAEAFAKLGAIAAQTKLLGPGAQMVAVYYDDPETTPPSELRSDAAISVAPGASLPAPLPEGLSELEIPSGRYACATHVGPYEQLGDAWSRLLGVWLPASGHRMKDSICFELYRNTPADVPKEQLQTELYVPLEP